MISFVPCMSYSIKNINFQLICGAMKKKSVSSNVETFNWYIMKLQGHSNTMNHDFAIFHFFVMIRQNNNNCTKCYD